MFTQEDDDILTLLATTIFADKRVYAKEIETFLSVAQELKVGAERSNPVTQTTLLLWFEANRDELAQIHDRKDASTWLHGLIDRLSGYSDKDTFLAMMSKISESDGEIHISEIALSAICARRWKLSAA